MNEFLSTADFAELLNPHESAVRESRTKGDNYGLLLGHPAPPHFKFKRKVLYKRSDIDAFISRARVDTSAEPTSADDALLCELVSGLTPSRLYADRGAQSLYYALTADEYALLEKLRRRSAVYIDDGVGFEQRKERLTAYAKRWAV